MFHLIYSLLNYTNPLRIPKDLKSVGYVLMRDRKRRRRIMKSCRW